MTRQQKRKLERENKRSPISYTVTKNQLSELVTKEIQDLIKKQRQDIMTLTTDSVIASFVMCLHDKFGFGESRIKKLLGAVNTQFECILDGHVDLDDITLWVKEKFDIDLMLTSDKNSRGILNEKEEEDASDNRNIPPEHEGLSDNANKTEVAAKKIADINS